MSRFESVLAYGGPLSYAFDEAATALSGLLRVTRGPVVASVMSTLGAYRHLLPAVLELAETYGDDVNDRILATGDLRETQAPVSGLHTLPDVPVSRARRARGGRGGSTAGALREQLGLSR
ncbi:MAG: hypothetical protein QOE01_1425 [Actinomycetota bacterium]|nr:hypothetical protein [Actinomycetota bacterium]